MVDSPSTVGANQK